LASKSFSNPISNPGLKYGGKRGVLESLCRAMVWALWDCLGGCPEPGLKCRKRGNDPLRKKPLALPSIASPGASQASPDISSPPLALSPGPWALLLPLLMVPALSASVHHPHLPPSRPGASLPLRLPLSRP